MLRWIFAIAGAWLLVGLATSAQAQSANSAACALTYHGALGQMQSSRADGLSAIFKQMRSADATLPGRWLFGLPPQNARTKKSDPTRPRVEKVCVEEQRINGRLRCQRFDERAVPSTEIGFRVAPTADESRVLKGLNDFVEGRGAIAEVGNNGRYSWLVQRMAQDLRVYISQPAHPALCSGGRELGEFYDTQLGPLHKRVQDIDALVIRARELALTRAREAVGLADILKAQGAQRGRAGASPAGGGAGPDAGSANLSSDDLAVISRRASDSVDALMPLDGLVKTVGRTFLTETEIADVQGDTSVLAMLRRVRTSVLTLQDRVVAGEIPDGMSVESIDAGKRALRMIEAAENALQQRRAYQSFIDLVLLTPQSILKAHKASCTCEE